MGKTNSFREEHDHTPANESWKDASRTEFKTPCGHLADRRHGAPQTAAPPIIIYVNRGAK